MFVQDTGVSFMVTPPKGGAFTPNKTLLMNRERRMNMMTPNRADKIFNTDIETGKVINEWGFKKDGIDVEMLVPHPPAAKAVILIADLYSTGIASHPNLKPLAS